MGCFKFVCAPDSFVSIAGGKGTGVPHQDLKGLEEDGVPLLLAGIDSSTRFPKTNQCFPCDVVVV